MLKASQRACCVFPAHAGMDRVLPRSPVQSLRVPRTRGDGPVPQGAWSRCLWVFPAHAGMDRGSRAGAATCGPCSPHTRGWTALIIQPFLDTHRVPRTRGDGPLPTWSAEPGFYVFPAHAGMDRSFVGAGLGGKSVPRTRGDGPASAGVKAGVFSCSPHTRGWTVLLVSIALFEPVFPAHAGMDRRKARACYGIVPCSPHTRGWTVPHPVSAGLRPGVPRTRGDGPASKSTVQPWANRVPRTRGDGPSSRTIAENAISCSPHTRGWTGGRRGPSAVDRGCSPHTRGWTSPVLPAPVQTVVFPAHAGMDRISIR